MRSTRQDSLLFYKEVLDKAAVIGSDRLRDMERYLCRNDLFYLLAVMLNRKDVNRDWLFDRCREVEKDRNGYLDLWSREHYKSTIVTFALTIQDILRDPEVTVGIFSHTRSIATDFLVQIKREFETNEKLKERFSDILWSNPHKDAPSWSSESLVVKRLSNPKEGSLEAHGLVEGQPVGRHFRIRVYDDTVTQKSVFTPEQISKTTASWELSLNLGMTAEQGGVARYIGTRYNLADTYSTMIQRGAVIPRIYPATHNGRFDGRPVLFSEAEWQKRLSDSSRQTVAAQLLQSPMADTDATFRTEWLKAYEVRPRTLNVYIMADPSRGRSATSDNTAIAVVGISSTGSKYLLDALAHRMTLSQRWTALRNLYRKWSRAKGINHISVGYERFGAQSDDEYFQEQMDRDKEWFTIEELNWTGDGTVSKQQRVERLEPDFRNGRFFLPLPVWNDGQASVWRVDTDPESKAFQSIEYRPVGGLTKQQMAAVAGGSADLLAKSLKATDQDGRVYDATKHFMQEFSTFPFGALKDLIDATSRIYDMGAMPPVLVSQADTEPPQFWDS